jgi:ubiquinol-cytochrome c reductase cytochrome b subunit
MFSKLVRWINDRWPLSALVKLGLEEDIPGGASYAYIFGSSALIMFAVQAATGVLQLFYYVPTIDHAYSSLSYFRLSVPFGWLIHGMHYWGANAMLVLVWLHIARVFVWGAYKKPRELTWLIGVFLLLTTLGLSFTGAPLPWDETGYWATEVGTSIAGTVPILGDFLKRLARGSESMGQLALSRFFILHVAILPGFLATLIGAHLIAFRKSGSVGRWNEAKRKRIGPFWPDQVTYDAVAGVVFFLIVVALASFAIPPFSGPADPVDTSFVPKPEWNFLFLYQAIKAFRGVFEPVGTVGLPMIATIIILLAPFLDRRKERDPYKRPFAMAVLFASIAGLVALTIAGAGSKPGLQQPAVSGPPAASPGGTTAGEGAKLFQSLGCIGCHWVNRNGGKTGPDLSAEGKRGRSRDWLVSQVQNPKGHNPKSVMPPFPALSASQLNGLVGFLLSLGAEGPAGQAPVPGATSAPAQVSPPGEMGAAALQLPGQKAAEMIGNPGHGAKLYVALCESCHGPEGKDKVANPGSEDGTVPPLNPIDKELVSPDPEVFAANLDKFIQHGSTPAGPNPTLKMQDFGDSNTLTQQEIANIEAYVLQLNGVERAQIMHPGLAPPLFFGLTIAAFGLALLWLLGVRYKGRNSGRPQIPEGS